MRDLGKEPEDPKAEPEKPEGPARMVVVPRDVKEKEEGKRAFLSGMKYRQQEGEYSFEHTMWRVYEMLWEKYMDYGHTHDVDDEVEDEMCQDIMAWLATMSGHGEEGTREDRLKVLFREFRHINDEPGSRDRVHKFFNLTGLAAFHHNIGFRQPREKTDFEMTGTEKEEIEVEFRAKVEEWEKQLELKAEVQSR